MAEQTRIEGIYTIRLEQGPALREFEKLNKQLADTRAKRTELNKQVRENIKAEQQLAAVIKGQGAATDEQTRELSRLRVVREALNQQQSEAVLIERGLSAQTRELSNDLAGLTENGLRFRDKMAEATTEALKQSGVLGQLNARYDAIQADISATAQAMDRNTKETAELNAQMKSGAITAAQHAQRMAELKRESTQLAGVTDKLEKELGQVNGKMGELNTRVDALNADLKAGRITTEEFKRGIAGINSSVAQQTAVFKDGVNGVKSYFAGFLGVTAALGAIGALGKELFNLAGEIEKVDARNRAIAGDSLPRFQAAAEAQANAIGLTRREYVSLAADQKLVLNQLGIEGSLVDDLSVKIVEYADLLGDFSGGALEGADAAKLLNDALLGKTKGLKELGINVKASAGELEALKAELIESRGLTEAQAEAVANLELVFRATADATAAFGDETLALDRAQDAANARMNEAREILAQKLTPAFIALTEGSANATKSLADFSDSGGFRKFVAFITAGASEGAIASYKGFFGTIDEGAKDISEGFESAAQSTEQLEARLKKLVDLRAAFRAQGKEDAAVMGDKEIAELEQQLALRKAKDDEAALATAKRANTVASLRGELTRLKEAREDFDETDTAGLAKNAEQIAAIEKRISVIDGAAKAINKQEAAERKLTEAQREQVENESNARADVNTGLNIFKLDESQALDDAKRFADQINEALKESGPERLRALYGLNEEVPDEVFVFSDKIIESRTEFDARLKELQDQNRINEIAGIQDFNLERELLEAQYNDGRIASREELNARLAALDDAERQRNLASAQELVNSLSALGNSIIAMQSAVTANEVAELDTRIEARRAAGQDTTSLEAEKDRKLQEGARKAFQIQRAIALAQIAVDTAKAISSLTAASTGNPFNAVTYGAAGAAQFAAGMIQIAANMAQAIALLSQKAPGYAKGGTVDDPSGTVTSGWGAPVTRANGDNVLVRAGRGFVTLKTGEKVLNRKQQQRLEDQTHPGIWSQIGVPGSRRGRSGYASGGAVRGVAMVNLPSAPTTGRPNPSSSQIMQSDLASQLARFANRPIVASWTEGLAVGKRIELTDSLSTM